MNFDTSATVNGVYNVPGNTLLRNTGTVATFNTAAMMGSLTLTQNGPRMTGSGNVMVAGLTDWAGNNTTIDGTGTLFANGGFDINAGGGTNRTLGRLIEVGAASTWTNSFASTVFNSGGGIIRNLGGNTITATNTVDLTLNVAFDNLGTFEQTAAGSLIVNGTLTNSNPSIIDVQAGQVLVNTAFTNSGTIDLTGGIFTAASIFDNVGTIKGTSTLNVSAGTFTNQSGGIVAPGASIGTMFLIGNAVFAAGSTFIAEVENLASDLLNAAGFTVTIQPGAILDIRLSGGPNPVGGEMFNVITGATVATTFDTVLEPPGLTFGQANPSASALELTLLGAINIWTGPLLGEFWNNAINWSLGTPLPAQDVAINTAATVTHSAGVDTVNSLSLNTGALLNLTGGTLIVSSNLDLPGGGIDVNGGTLTVGGPTTLDSGSLLQVNAGAFNPNTLTMNGGELGGPQNVTFPGLITWIDGTMSGMGTTFANGGIDIGAAFAGAMMNRNIEHFGPATWMPSGNNTVDGTGTFTHQGGNLTVASRFFFDPDFVNNATFTVNVPGNLAGFGQVDNTGTVQVTAGTFRIDSGGTNTGNVSISGGAKVLFRSDYVFNNGGLFGGGTLEIDTGPACCGITINGLTSPGAFDPAIIDVISGQLNVSTTQTMTSSINLANGALLRISPTGNLTLNAAFVNTGDVIIDPTGTGQFLLGYTQNSGSTLVNGVLQTPVAVDINGGMFGGNGTVNVIGGAVNNIGGVVSAGTSPGFLSILGDYTQSSGATLLVDLVDPGLVPGADFDFINITGTANLDGDLLVNPLGGFAPPMSTGFDILNFSAVAGNFASISSTSAQSFSGVLGATDFMLFAGTPPAMPMALPPMAMMAPPPPMPELNQDANVIGDTGGGGGSGFDDDTGSGGTDDDDGTGTEGTVVDDDTGKTDDSTGGGGGQGDGDDVLPQLCSA